MDHLLVQVCKLHRNRGHERFEELGVYRGQPPMLHALWNEEGMTHSELARRLHVQPATMTKMVKRMEKAGFVERRSDPQDQRVSRVYLTDQGRAIQAAVREVWHEIESETFAGFSPEELELLRRFLFQMRDNLLQVTRWEPHHR
jgi:DNA-binding MarR family transcriptional regulator